MPLQLSGAKVANLMSVDGQTWDLEVINDLFNSRDASLILSTLVQPNYEDGWYWSGDIIEYSPSKDAAFCLPCYLFHTQDGPPGLHAFTINGFRSWKKVRDGKNCSFLTHIGKDLTSPHRNAEKACADLMNQQSHIAHHIEKFTSQEVVENRLRLRTSIEATRWLALQGCSFRVTKVLDKAPRNATYTSPTTQKQILQVLATKVKSAIRDEIGDAKKEQMSIVLRFVDRDGFIQERFFGVVHVKDTIASTLKECDTRWSSHLKSISSLMRMFSATCEVLLNIIEDGTTPTHRGDADAAYELWLARNVALWDGVVARPYGIWKLVVATLQ
nr:zinc finger MYM-type protein 1-like [Ipomoea batatas]